MVARKDHLSTDALREIRGTFNRYVSILVLAALAVAFLAGLRTTAPDMQYTADNYYDRTRLMDGYVLSTLGLTSVFVAIPLLCHAILQANGMVNLPILAVVAGGVTKILVNHQLVGNPDIRINGAPVGTLCCFIVISALEIFIIRRAIPKPPSFLRAFLKPFLASAVMAAAAWAFRASRGQEGLIS